MPIIQTKPAEERGKKDARRHRDKQREAIKEKVREIIADETIITRKKGRTVKIPIRGIVIPDFRPGTRKKGKEGDGEGGGVGVGQGSGKPGDVVGQRPGQGQQPGGAGEGAGDEPIESEIDIEELIEMMYEDLGLPKLKDREIAQLETILGYRIRGIRKSGPLILLDKKGTAGQGVGRFYSYLEILKQETGRDELICFEALRQSDGSLAEALKLLEDENFTTNAKEIEPFLILHEKDLRFYDIREQVSYHSNAVVIAMMDVSGSMSTMKKYLARSLLFWLVEFLRKIYDNVEIRFIIHHSEARLVDEDSFFHTGESGGTKCHKAYDLARGLIEAKYPTNQWNVYAFHFSDGEDWDAEQSVESARKLIEGTGINMFGYGEIQADGYYPTISNLLPAFQDQFPLEKKDVRGMETFIGKGDFPFLGVVIRGKEHIWQALQEFLRKDRWIE